MNKTYEDVLKMTKEVCSPMKAEIACKFLSEIKEVLEVAPASTSTSRHHAEKGGLITHIFQIFDLLTSLAEPIREKLPEGKKDILSPESLWLVSLLHDISKVCDASKAPFYVENILTSGKPSTAKPYKVNPDYLTSEEEEEKGLPLQRRLILRDLGQIQDGILSLSLIESLSPELYVELKDYERQAIRFHAGGYGDAKYAANGKENPLTILLHCADMLSSRWRNVEEE